MDKLKSLGYLNNSKGSVEVVKYARKSSIVDVEFPQEDGFVLASSGNLPYYKGDVITRNRYGDREVYTRNTFDEFFTPVVEVNTSEDFKKEFENAYANWNGSELNSNEDEDYITETLNVIYNKVK